MILMTVGIGGHGADFDENHRHLISRFQTRLATEGRTD